MFYGKTLILALALFTGVCTLYNSNSPVVQLTEQNFDQLVIKSDQLWLVEFFAPWCGHCKNLTPEWEKAARALKGIVQVGAVDADTYKSLGGRFGVNGFPTIKFFGTNKNQAKDYDQGRTANDIVNYAKARINEVVQDRLGGKSNNSNSSGNNNQNNQNQNKNTGGAGSNTGSDKDVIVLTDDNFDDNVFNSKDMWLIEFYAPWCGHCKNLEPEWNIAATELKGKVKVAKVDATVNQKLGSRFQVKGYPTIKIFPPGDKSDSKAEAYEGGRSSDVIINQALEKLEKYGYIPDIEQLYDPATYKTACEDSGRTCVLAFLPNMYESNSVQRYNYINTFKKVSTVGRGKPMNFFWVSGGDFYEYEEKMGLTFGFPAVIIVSHSKKKYSVMKNAYEYDAMKSFLNKVLIGATSLSDFPKVLPPMKKAEPWNGLDLEIIPETTEDL